MKLSKKDKLVQNILNNPKNESFENLKKVLGGFDS